MKSFLYKIVVFITVPLVLFTLVYVFNLQKRIGYIQNISVNNDVIIMGDSQMQRINPDNFNAKTFNFSSIGESYNITFYKLNKILSEKENNIKTLILGASIHSFSFDYEKRYDHKTPQGKFIFEKNLYYMPLFNDPVFPFKNKLVEKLFYFSIFKEPKNSGYGESSNKNPTKDIIDIVLKIHYGENPNIDVLNQEKYFQKIIDLCKKRKVKVIIVSTPYHNYYKKNIPNYNINKFDKIIKDYKNITFLNYINDKTPDYLFSDGNHLNKEGGNRYAKKIAKNL